MTQIPTAAMSLRTVIATRYVTALREGGSLPGIVEASDDGMYVVKFRGAAQGPKALVAELISGEIARALDLPVPEIVFVEFDQALGKGEPDWELQELLERSTGLNLGLDYLPGALPFDPLVKPPPDPDLAARIVWFDAFVTNVDRTPRNTNMLMWHKQLWLIDHGASLYFHHTWANIEAQAVTPFNRVKDHVLLPFVTEAALDAADAESRPKLTEDLLRSIVAAVPDAWLGSEDAGFDSPDAHREGYVTYFVRRLAAADRFVEEAKRARAAVLDSV